ncbi:MAG: DUF2225 domain-containing protein [Bacteroidia bacterium]
MKAIRQSLLILIILNYPNTYAFELKDTALVNELNQKVFDLVYNQTEFAKKSAYEALDISLNINYLYGEIQSYSRLGIVYDVEGNFDSAIFFYNKSLHLSKKHKNLKSEGAALCNIGLLYLNHNQYTESLKNLHAAIKPFEKIKAYQFLGSCYNNIGLLYQELDNYSRAMVNYKLAINNYNKVQNVGQKANAIGNLAALFDDLNKHDSSISLYKEAIAIYVSNNDYYNLGKSYNNIAQSYNRLGQIKKTEELYLLSIENAEKANNIFGLAGACVNLGILYDKQGKKEKSLFYLKKAYLLCDKISSPKLKSEVYNRYGKILSDAGSLKLANKLLIAAFDLKDSVFKYETANNIAKQEVKFGIERKENENQKLKQTNRIQELEILNKRTEIKNRQIMEFGVLGTGLILIGFSTYFLRKRYLIKSIQERNRHIEEQQSQRLSISQELHDNVGAQLSYVVSKLEMIKTHLNDNSDIDAASKMSKQAIITLRETVWALNKESISVEDFSDKFKSFAYKMVENHPEIEIEFDEKIKSSKIFTPNTALNIFRICQEAFTNILKHAQANSVQIKIESLSNHSFSCCISDNGVGFDESNNPINHYGLKNMKSRAEDIGLSFNISSSLNKGTTITLNLP